MIYVCEACGARIMVTEKGPPGYTMNDQRRELPGLCPACALAHAKNVCASLGLAIYPAREAKKEAGDD